MRYVLFVSYQKETKKKSVTATLYEDSERLVVSKKQGCDWGACGRLIKILENVIGRNREI